MGVLKRTIEAVTLDIYMNKIIPIEGGLGAQILTYMIINDLREKGIPFKVDLRYFQNVPKIAKDGEGVSIFKWELDYFGISFDDLKNASKINLIDKIQKKLIPNVHIKDGGVYKIRCLREAMLNANWKLLFPIQTKDEIKAKEIIGEESHIAVHIRKGDFLNVASHVTSEDMIIRLLKKFRGCNINKLIIITDGEVDLKNFQNELTFIKKFVIQKNIYNLLSHAIMRKASILITSNSQFSLTAGLLNESGVVITPKKWFSSPKINIEFEKMLSGDAKWNLI